MYFWASPLNYNTNLQKTNTTRLFDLYIYSINSVVILIFLCASTTKIFCENGRFGYMTKFKSASNEYQSIAVLLLDQTREFHRVITAYIKDYIKGFLYTPCMSVILPSRYCRRNWKSNFILISWRYVGTKKMISW